jgi:hypothetical protein
MYTESIAPLSATHRKAFGGVCSNTIKYVKSNNNHICDDVIDDTVVPLTLGGGESWKTLVCADRSVHFSELEVIRDGIRYYKVSLRFVVPGDQADRINFFHGLCRGKQILTITDTNGTTKMIGMPNDGAKCKRDRDNKSVIEERNEIEGIFSWTSRFPCPVVVPR